jgi:DNA polymerase-4
MHIDFNSCFASIEQQANPLLRGKPLVVVPYLNFNSGCVLTASREARKFGVKTGMRLNEAKKLCPEILMRQADPAKYRFVHKALRKILEEYSDKLRPKSIDEFVLDFNGCQAPIKPMILGEEIKGRIKKEIGEWLTVSIGFGPSTFLAKMAAGLKKPDGLEVIDKSNYREIYEKLELTDLCGINTRLALRLNLIGIKTITQMFEATPQKLKEAFRSVAASYWYLRLRGQEVDVPDQPIKSFGHTYSLPERLSTTAEWMGVLAKLSEKASFRMRKNGSMANALTVVVSFRDGDYFKKTIRLNKSDGDFGMVGKLVEICLAEAPQKVARNLSITYHNLSRKNNEQEELISEVFKREKAIVAMDKLKEKWGEWIIKPARMTGEIDSAPDAISFGNIR